jgi:exodeoxyribonuclease VII large subunit
VPRVSDVPFPPRLFARRTTRVEVIGSVASGASRELERHSPRRLAAAAGHPRTTLATVAQLDRAEALRFDFSEPSPTNDVVMALPDVAVEATGADEAQVDEAIEMAAGAGAGAVDEALDEPARIPGASPGEALSVGEFYDRVRYALRSEFPGELWVTGEIRKVTVRNGNRYLELADRHTADRSGAATLDVACWSRDWPLIGAELQDVGLELTSGLVVRLRGRAQVWEGGSRLRFAMTELDVASLVGGIAAARRRLIANLDREGLLLANRRLPLSPVPLRVGLVTSPGSDAYRDFTSQLTRSGFSFEVRFEPSLVQGPDSPVQLANAIRRLHRFGPDLIVVVRGGGAKGDLAAFDSPDVARAIATSRVQVWTGIGHTGDQSVADEVAARALITPTACGEAIVAQIGVYVASIAKKAHQVASRGSISLEQVARFVTDSRGRLAGAARHELDEAHSNLLVARGRASRGAIVSTERQQSALGRRAGRLESTSERVMTSAEQVLARQRARLDAFDPRQQLARGWSMTRTTDGRVLRSVREAPAGSSILTVLADGRLLSVVEQSGGGSDDAGKETP